MDAREHKFSTRELERRLREAEERAEKLARGLVEGRWKGVPKPEGRGGEVKGMREGSESGNKESEVWRLMSAASEDQDGGGDGDGDEEGAVKEMEKNRHQ